MKKIYDDIYQRFRGFKSVKRGNKNQGESDWYYVDPRYKDDDERGKINVVSENSINPRLNGILADDLNKNPEDYYIWRTKKDEKVRGKHAEREGKIFNKHIPPEGGNPGEDYNCRCWAEPYKPEKIADKQQLVDLSGLDMFKEHKAKSTKSIKQYAENDKSGVMSDAVNYATNKDKPYNLQQFPEYRLGSLSSSMESSDDPAIIGTDNAGGPSYGLYQIATNPGTMKLYIKYLQERPQYEIYADLLNQAGGNEGAKNKSIQFVDMWKKLSKDSSFNDSQFNFIVDTHLSPLINKAKFPELLDIERRHPVVKDALYSVSVQHAGALKILNDTLRELYQNYGNNIDDENFLKTLYKNRTEYVRALKESERPGDKRITKEEKYNIIHKRYPEELRKALRYLKCFSF